MTRLGYQPKILLPEGEFFRFEILSAEIEDGEYGYQLGLKLKTLGGKHAGHTFKDWSKISGDKDDGLFIKEGSKAEELVRAVLGADADLEDLDTDTRSKAGDSWPALPFHRTASVTALTSALSVGILLRIPKRTSGVNCIRRTRRCARSRRLRPLPLVTSKAKPSRPLKSISY